MGPLFLVRADGRWRGAEKPQAGDRQVGPDGDSEGEVVGWRDRGGRPGEGELGRATERWAADALGPLVGTGGGRQGE